MDKEFNMKAQICDRTGLLWLHGEDASYVRGCVSANVLCVCHGCISFRRFGKGCLSANVFHACLEDFRYKKYEAMHFCKCDIFVPERNEDMHRCNEKSMELEKR